MIRDTLIFDRHLQICAIITRIGQPTDSPHRETRAVYDVSDTFCPIQQPSTHH
ncbi:BgTH12-03504 [Blumeria graminis f. sp. triticale]|uniref:BgTH12-03504 n=1 Tax=Blumeria graminis f. sp. triticale TaxID=1689686 RepID=A0A9W4GCI0_BLUGR|nr:BgTH12-03504 [Blumeria graminis f. sp. triticale]